MFGTTSFLSPWSLTACSVPRERDAVMGVHFNPHVPWTLVCAFFTLLAGGGMLLR